MYLGERWGGTVIYRGVRKGPTGKKPGEWEGVSQVVIAEGGELQAEEGPVPGSAVEHTWHLSQHLALLS